MSLNSLNSQAKRAHKFNMNITMQQKSGNSHTMVYRLQELDNL